MIRHTNERGVTAIFLVIFAAILLSVITLSFAQMMIKEQSNSLDNILSQAAYDSATSGVEDAKRTILYCRSNPSVAGCSAASLASCNANGVVTGATIGETVIQSSSGAGLDLDQAYTCVKIDMNKPTVLRSVALDKPVMIPLSPLSGTINQISIEWQQRGDIGGGDADATPLGDPLNPCHNATANLCSITGWGNAPALLEAQFILPNTSFSLSDLDANNFGQTLYLRPALHTGTLPPVPFNSQNQRYTASQAPIANGTPNKPTPVVCKTDVGSPYFGGNYACQVMINGLTITPAQGKVSFLRLSALYRGAAVRITFLDAAGTPVKSDNVQADVDSTGRANDVYRRIDSRLEFGNDTAFPLPQNAVDLGGSLCKDFGVTTTGVSTASTCTP